MDTGEETVPTEINATDFWKIIQELRLYHSLSLATNLPTEMGVVARTEMHANPMMVEKITSNQS